MSKEITSKYEDINFIPSEEDIRNLSLIENFLNEEEIPYEKDESICGLYRINDVKGNAIELRYINSYHFPMDNSKRFGESCKGVQWDYFYNISRYNSDHNIRVIWIFDFEMSQTNDTTSLWQGERGYHRQWEVIKNTIRTACGRIRHRFRGGDFIVKEVDNKELRKFLDTNCFYGYRSANINLGLYLKKDKHGYKKGDLIMVLTFGYNFYGNKKRPDDPFIEIIRASTRIGCQVIGGMSKLLKYFCINYPTLTIGSGKNKHEIKVRELKFYCDASHNDGRGMSHSALAFRFDGWDYGFMNRYTDDVDEDGLHGVKGEIFHRKPHFHKTIMRLIGEGRIISIANAGTSVFSMTRDELLDRFSNN